MNYRFEGSLGEFPVRGMLRPTNEKTDESEIHPSGFEPETLGSEDRCAIQLRHGCSYFYIVYRKAVCPSIAVTLSFKASFPKNQVKRQLPLFDVHSAALDPPNR